MDCYDNLFMDFNGFYMSFHEHISILFQKHYLTSKLQKNLQIEFSQVKFSWR